MSTVGKRVIYAGPADGAAFAHPQTVEGKALSAVLPGSLVKQIPTGLDASDIAATVFGQLPIFANKDEMGTSKSVDDAWTINENMVAIQARSGEFMNVIVASGQNITSSGVGLSSNGDGTLKIAATNGSEEILAYSDEIINTGAGTALVRVVIK